MVMRIRKILSSKCVSQTSRKSVRVTIAVSIGLAGFAHGTLVVAQTSDAVAESLFRDGKSYFQVEDYGHACPKFAQSYRIDPAGGTVLLLAICYEKQGKLASAWTRYNDALAIAKRDGREDRERRAREGLESVEPKLSYIKLTFDPTTQTIPGVTLSIDGTELPAISDTRLPVDSGTHQLAIHAPNYESWQVEVTIGGPAETHNMIVPALRSSPALPAQVPSEAPVVVAPTLATKSTEPTEPVSHARARQSAYIIGGAGLAAVAVGSYFGIRAIQLNSEANRICPTSQCRGDQAGAITKSEAATAKAQVADVIIGAGSAAIISAAVLWYVYKDDFPRVTAYANPTSRALSVGWQQSF